MPKGELYKAIAEYEWIITFDPKSEGRYLIHPIYYYWLAKLYEQKDWKANAIEHYEKFLDLWKDADPGIPEVEDGKKRLAGLKSQRSLSPSFPGLKKDSFENKRLNKIHSINLVLQFDSFLIN
ncbi:MAG: tol-pal system YbgF family protein [Candidatus Aminicenantaceae bacterium]